jgi:hypothetical protein
LRVEKGSGGIIIILALMILYYFYFVKFIAWQREFKLKGDLSAHRRGGTIGYPLEQ